MKHINYNSKIILIVPSILLLILIITSCRSVPQCEEHQILGNMGNVVNSNLDEHSPSICVLPPEAKRKFPNADTNDYLYYTTTLYHQGNEEQIFNILLDDIKAGSELISDENFPLNNTTLLRNAGVPVFRYNPISEKLDVYFAALPKMGRLSRDIWFAEKDLNTDIWTTPIQVPIINTPHWESHPTISPDGKILLFSSDRPGGEGDIDIWASFQDENGIWGQPINLGPDINTTGADYTPMFLDNFDIIFSTNGRGTFGKKDFDIYHAKYDSIEKRWHSPKKYGYPINTEFNETGATIFNNRIFLSSDRRGGCGGKDIYSFQLCGPVTIAGNVRCPAPKQILEGHIYILDEYGEVVTEAEVLPDGSFQLDEILPNKNYTIDYVNRCYPLKKNRYDFRSPCSDSSVVKVLISMTMPEKTAELELTEVEIPFFVTGYYKPNTEANLNALKLSFSYNLYGNNNKSRYIENPGENYNQFVNQVEASLDDVVRYMAQMVAVLDNKCLPQQDKGRLFVNVQGYADPRNISAESEYLGEDIDDKRFNFRVKKGTKMNNDLLSKLRAYFTAKYFEAQLINEFNLRELSDNILWTIEGKGVDTAGDVEDGLKRRVKISLQFVE